MGGGGATASAPLAAPTFDPGGGTAAAEAAEEATSFEHTPFVASIASSGLGGPLACDAGSPLTAAVLRVAPRFIFFDASIAMEPNPVDGVGAGTAGLGAWTALPECDSSDV